jgi:hypothetical protein
MNLMSPRLGNVGSMLHFATVTLEKLVGFTAAFALTGGCIVIAALVLLLGGRWYGASYLQTLSSHSGTNAFQCDSHMRPMSTRKPQRSFFAPLETVSECRMRTLSTSLSIVKRLCRGVASWSLS